MNDATKTLLALFARRAFTAAGVWLASKGLIQGDPSGFVGACMVLAEVAYEGWNRYGMVLVNAQLAKLKGVHPAQMPAPPAPPASPAVKAMLAIFAVLLASLIFGHPAMAQSSRINSSTPKPALTGNLAKDIKAGLNPASATTAAPSSGDDLANFMAQLEKVTSDNVAAVIADLQLADIDAGTIITPAIAASPAIAATATSPAVPAFAGSPAVVKDAISHACYPAAVQFLQSIPAVAAPTGKFVGMQLFQAKRDFVAELQAGLPTYLVLGCAPLLGDEIKIAVQVFNMIGIKVLPATLTALMPALAPVTLPAMIMAP